MAKAFLIYVTAERVSGHLWQDNRLLEEWVFAEGEAGARDFNRAVSAAGGRPLAILTDLVEEDYRFEHLPHVIGPERASLFGRKLEQYYRSTPYRYAAVQGRAREGRRDDQVLFSAITNASLLSPWLDLTEKREAPVRGIYSVPLVSKALLAGISVSHVLLLTWEKHAGLRQTYFVDSNLRFTRLTGAVGNESLVERVVSESGLTKKYLGSLSMLPKEHPLDICIICGGQDRRELEAKLRPMADVRFHFLDTRDVARRMGFAGNLDGSDASPLLLHALAKKPPENQYGSARNIHFFSIWKLRRTLQAVAAAVLVATVGWSFANVWLTRESRAESAQLAKEAATLDRTYKRLTADFPQLGISTQNMKVALNAVSRVERYVPPTDTILAGVSAALGQNPNVQLRALSWETSFSPESVAAGSEAQPASPPVAAGPDALPAQVILLKGEVWPFDGDFRKALETIERFRGDLARAGLEATILSLPLDLSPDATLSRSADAHQAMPPRAAFEMKLVMRPKP